MKAENLAVMMAANWALALAVHLVFQMVGHSVRQWAVWLAWMLVEKLGFLSVVHSVVSKVGQ